MPTLADAAARALVFLDRATAQLGGESLTYTEWNECIERVGYLTRELAEANVRPTATTATIAPEAAAIARALDRLRQVLVEARDADRSFPLDLQLDDRALAPESMAAREGYALATAIIDAEGDGLRLERLKAAVGATLVDPLAVARRQLGNPSVDLV